MAGRIGLVVVGLLLLAAAGTGGLLATGAIDRLSRYADSDQPVLNGPTRSLLTDHQGAFQAGAAAVAVVLVTVGQFWLVGQLPPWRRRDDVDLDVDLDPPAPPGAHTDPGAAGSVDQAAVAAGRTRIAGVALVHALEDDLVGRGEGIHRARADYRRHHRKRPPELRLRLDVDPSCPVDGLLGGPVTAAVDRFVTVAGLTERPTVLTDLRLAVPDRPRVA